MPLYARLYSINAFSHPSYEIVGIGPTKYRALHLGYSLTNAQTLSYVCSSGLAAHRHENPWRAEFDSLMTRLNSLKTYPVDWNGDGAESPNEVSVSNGRRVLGVANELDFMPTNISPSAEGGVGISFVRGNRYADIECFNTGEMWAVTSDRVNAPTVWKVEYSSIRSALEKIREHVQSA